MVAMWLCAEAEELKKESSTRPKAILVNVIFINSPIPANLVLPWLKRQPITCSKFQAHFLVVFASDLASSGLATSGGAVALSAAMTLSVISSSLFAEYKMMGVRPALSAD